MQMENGTPVAARNAALEQVEGALIDLNDEWVAENPDSLPMVQNIGVWTTGE